MKLLVYSDLHIENSPYAFSPESLSSADVVVMPGDVGEGMRGIRYAADLSRAGTPVVYVAGNHEYLGKEYHAHLAAMREYAKDYRNLHFLEQDAAVIDGVRFLGTTLWPGFNLLGEIWKDKAMLAAKNGAPDYTYTRFGNRTITPQDHADLFKKASEWLSFMLATPFKGPSVVVTHFAPHKKSSRKGYISDLISPYFANTLNPLLFARPALWLHGHTHKKTRYTVDQAEVFSFPRGYPSEVASEPGMLTVPKQKQRP